MVIPKMLMQHLLLSSPDPPVREKRGGLEHNPGRKCPEGRNSATGVDRLQYRVLNHYRIAGNFRGRKLSRISRFFSHPRKFSPRSSRHATPIIRSVFAFRESFLRERVFSLENFPLYRILERTAKRAACMHCSCACALQ